MLRALRWFAVLAVVIALAAPARAQQPEAKPPEKPKTLLEELVFFSYIENSYVGNLHGAGKGDVNELRFYDFDNEYTFNMAEFSVKKDPSDRYPFGFGLVVTGGQDARKNHALGIFRGDDDVFPFKDTPPIDLQEAYGSYKIPIGSGLTLKAGKWVTLLGYEVIESPNNLNFSRSFLFSFAIPLTHVGALASYSFTDWLTVSAGPVVGWDVARDNNDRLSLTGQVALTPFKDFSTNLNWITGPEQPGNDTHVRTVLDWTATYTGIKNLTLGLNTDYGREEKEPSLVGLEDGRDTTATWWGTAAYAAYDWTEKLRTALRAEYFQDTDGVRTVAIAPGKKVDLTEVTATLQYKIWRGLVGRLEFRHDGANGDKVFKIRAGAATRSTQDTITLALYYSFF